MGLAYGVTILATQRKSHSAKSPRSRLAPSSLTQNLIDNGVTMASL